MRLTGELIIDTELMGDITPQQLRKLNNVLVEALEDVLDSELANMGLEIVAMHPVTSVGLSTE